MLKLTTSFCLGSLKGGGQSYSGEECWGQANFFDEIIQLLCELQRTYNMAAYFQHGSAFEGEADFDREKLLSKQKI